MRLRAALVCLVVAAATVLLGAAPASAAPAPADTPDYTYVVVLKATPSWESAQALAGRYGGRLQQAFRTALRGFSARMTAEQAGRLATDPAVESVQRDRPVRSATVGIDPPSWGLDRVDQPNLPLNGAYTYPTGAANVTAYVIDSGIRTTHTDFGGRASSGWDFVDNDADADDCAGHGTHVAGTIGGSTYGVARAVDLVALRVLGCDGAGTYAGILAAVDWVTANAHKPAVVAMSLGGTTYAPLNEAVAASIASGVTYVVAAGNDGADACGYSPAGVAAAITVGATGRTDARAPFSNAGPCVDLFAPGVGIVSAGIDDDSARRSMTGTSIGAPSLLVQTAPSPCDVRTDGADVAIKDRGTVVSTIALTGCSGRASRKASWASVEVRIVHPRRGDLVVELIAPNGVVKRLKASNRHDRAADVSATYPVVLHVKDRTGTWRLRVRDTTRAATGHIDSWTLTVA